MNTPLDPPRFTTASARATVRALLRDGDYTESGLRASHPELAALPWRRRAIATGLTGGSLQETLVRLFLAELRVSWEEVRGACGADGTEALLASGLLITRGEGAQAAAALTPFGSLVVAHDRRDAHRGGAADYVPGPGPATRWFADCLVRRPRALTLDLGCGQGALGLLLAGQSREVLATDINPRALALTAFNAELNGVDNVEARRGDWFGSAAGRAFDAIVCNPPYVISPTRSYLYRDRGGDPGSGGGLFHRLVRRAPEHLTEGGVFQMVWNWPLRAGRDWMEDAARCFEGSGCDAWILIAERSSPAAYADGWLRQGFKDEDRLTAEYQRWMAYYEAEQIEEVVAGLVVLQKVTDRPPWIEIRDMPPSSEGRSGAIERTLLARSRIRSLPDDAALLAARLSLAPGCVQVATRRSGGQGWTTAHTELRMTRGISFAARVDPVAAGVVGLLDGERTLRQAAEALAASHGVPLEPLLPGLPKVARELMELGLLV